MSVIICARNEEKNLQKHLRIILEQRYPLYQVIVVNDCSWDGTSKALEELEKEFSHLKVVTILEQEKYRHGKKFALSLGIKAASHEVLLMTDADCRPAGKNWLYEMTKNINDKKEIVIGYGAYEKHSTLLNCWVRFDTALNAMLYISQAIKNNAYMGVGRNICYKKNLFFRNKGFAAHNHILSGDDDLFINQVATAENTVVELSPESFTYSTPKETFLQWLIQKKRHTSTAAFYKLKHKIILSLFFASQSFFYLLLITLLILKIHPEVVLLVFLVRLVIQFFIFLKCMQKLREADLAWLTPVFDLVTAVIYPILAILNLFVKKHKWK